MIQKTKRIQELRYRKRLVLFADFLGFKNVVHSTQNDPLALLKLIEALEEISRIEAFGDFKTERFSQFSDSVVLSYEIKEQSAVYWMISTMALAVIELANRGYLVRGAITYGDLYHTQKHVVGPALVRAYEMESEKAKYPRVIVDSSVLELARKYRQKNHEPNEEEAYIRNHLEQDSDGWLWIDYLSWKAVVQAAGAADEDYLAYMDRIDAQIQNGLRSSDERIRGKYIWLQQKHQAALRSAG
jgi:hypothetical protein